MKKNQGLHSKLENFNNAFFDQLEKGFPTESPIGMGHEITPLPYIWHVTNPSNSLGIHANGLEVRGNYSGEKLVFANNMIVPNQYAFALLSYAGDIYSSTPKKVCSINNEETIYMDPDFEPAFEDTCAHYGYDYWQIETSKINCNWWVDLAYDSDWAAFGGRDYYIYTNISIPRNAIKLFRFREYDTCSHHKGSVDGVYHAKYKTQMYEVKDFRRL